MVGITNDNKPCNDLIFDHFLNKPINERAVRQIIAKSW